jgi:hypothetical protein
VPIVSDRRIGTDEAKLIDAGLHVRAGTAICGERKVVIKDPQRACHRIAYARTSASSSPQHLRRVERTKSTGKTLAAPPLGQRFVCQRLDEQAADYAARLEADLLACLCVVPVCQTEPTVNR